MENRIKGIVIAIFVMLSISAAAQNHREYRQNNYQINQGVNMLQQDQKELADVKRDIRHMEKAMDQQRIQKVNAIHK